MSIWKKGKKKFGEHLLEKIKEISSINEQGKLQHEWGFEITPFDLLPDCIKTDQLGKDLNIDKLISAIIENLISNKQIINTANFEKKFNSYISKSEYFKTYSYQIVIEILLDTPENQKTRINDCEIRVITKKFSKTVFLKDFSQFLAKSVITVNCKSISSEMAVAKAIESIDLIRATWHLSMPRKWKIETKESHLKPYNPVIIGNYCYILQHETDVIWKRQRVNYIKEPFSQEITKLEPDTILQGKKILKKLQLIRKKNLEYYNKIANSMIQYIKALDSIDLTNSLPLLWGAIETIVMKSNENKYDMFIARCGFLYSDDFYVKNLLELIKEHRNNFVHNGFENIKLTKLFLIELETVYRDMLFFHLRHASNNHSFEDVIELLSSPLDTDTLERKKLIIEQAITFRSKGKAGKKK